MGKHGGRPSRWGHWDLSREWREVKRGQDGFPKPFGPVFSVICQVMRKAVSPALSMGKFSTTATVSSSVVLALAASLMLAACSAEDAGKKEDPVLFGSASGSNGAGGATSGMSFSW